MDIDKNTRVPLFSALVFLSILASYMFWMSSLYSTASRAEKKNEEQDQKIETIKDLILDIRERTIRIEEKINKKEK